MVIEILLAIAATAATAAISQVIDYVTQTWTQARPKEIPESLQAGMSAYDEKMIIETQQLIENTFCENGKSVTASIGDMSNVDRIKKADEFAKGLAKLYGLDIEVDVDVAAPEECGAYNWNQKKVCFNLVELMADVSSEHFEYHITNFIDTIIHEERHAVQHQALMTQGFWEIDDERREKWAWNMQRENYILANVDVRGYRMQPIELDAFTFANLSMQGVNM